ncbi:hypothetical protein CF326_g7988 [Tilletia indica]|nr:hypothetical protein CF326_g7988 [Tilletia indica]
MASIQGRTDYSDGKTQDDSVKDTGGWHLRTTGTAQTVLRGGKTTAGDLAVGAKVWRARIKVRNILDTAWLVRLDEDSAQLSGKTQRYKGTAEQETEYQDGRQGPRDHSGGSETGLTAPRTVTQAKPLTQSGRRHGKVRWFKTRRTTGTTQTVRRDGKTTGGDLTAAKAKLVREEEGGRLSYEGSERRDQGPPPIGTACAGTSRQCGRPRDGRINGTQRKANRPNLVWVHAISASVYRSGLFMPTILDRIHQAHSAQRCNEEIFKGKVAITHLIEALTAPSASHTLL